MAATIEEAPRAYRKADRATARVGHDSGNHIHGVGKKLRKLGKLKKLFRLPYWLSGHEQLCAACGHAHASAVEARCVACDRPQCPTCYVIEAGEVFCMECHELGGKSQWRRARSGKA